MLRRLRSFFRVRKKKLGDGMTFPCLFWLFIIISKPSKFGIWHKEDKFVHTCSALLLVFLQFHTHVTHAFVRLFITAPAPCMSFMASQISPFYPHSSRMSKETCMSRSIRPCINFSDQHCINFEQTFPRLFILIVRANIFNWQSCILAQQTHSSLHNARTAENITLSNVAATQTFSTENLIHWHIGRWEICKK